MLRAAVQVYGWDERIASVVLDRDNALPWIPTLALTKRRSTRTKVCLAQENPKQPCTCPCATSLCILNAVHVTSVMWNIGDCKSLFMMFLCSFLLSPQRLWWWGGMGEGGGRGVYDNNSTVQAVFVV